MIGIQNNVNLSNTLYAIGNSNNFQEANFNKSFGDGIDISGSSNVLNLGDDNVVYDSDQIIILNNDNNVLGSEAQTILGKNNVILNSTNNTVVGQYNLVESTNTNLFGDQNIAKGTGNYAYGNLNFIMSGNSDSSVYGTSNSMSGNDTSLILGYSNLVMSGTENFILGYGNEITASKNLVVLGQENKSIDTNKSYIFGENNVVGTRVDNSYIFGQNNFTSGFQNYVFGNDNTVRSGDYNSIFIGISYTPTGDSKVATISLASVDSKIEISPSEIRLDSINRPKINGENIIIQSEFDTVSNAIVNTGIVFSTNTFQDPSYDKLAETILVSSFNYDSGVDVGLSFGPQEFKATDSLFLNNFVIYSTVSYTGEDQTFNIIYGNHTSNPFTPRWLVVDKITSGVYYQNNITDFNVTPQIGWTKTGIQIGSDLYTGTSDNFSTSLVMGSRSGFMPVDTLSFGRAYIPILY